MSGHERLIDMAAAMQLGPVPYLLEPLIPRGAVVTITGIRGDSKTWLAMAACAAVQRGGELAEMPSARAPALLIDGENGRRILGQRFAVLGLQPDAFHVADGFGLRLPDDIKIVRQLIAATRARLVVLDSLRRLAPGLRENDSDDMAPLYAELAQLTREADGCSVVVLHHRSAKPGAPDSRGSTAIEDQSDICFVLERDADDPQRQTRRRLRNTKNRVDAELGPIWLDFTLTDGMMTVAAAETSEPMAFAAAAAPSAAEQHADRIRALAEAVDADGGWSPGRLADALGVKRKLESFQTALRMLYARDEWEETGEGRARLVRPTRPSPSPPPIEGSRRTDGLRDGNGHLTGVDRQAAAEQLEHEYLDAL